MWSDAARCIEGRLRNPAGGSGRKRSCEKPTARRSANLLEINVRRPDGSRARG
jgi:hypothetical protein